ncbi:MAG: cytochrome c oxidase accessory protein CcoG [Gammaproteobacteria bacterium]
MTTPVSTDEVQESLYEKRQKIYPREVRGLFAGLRVTAVVTLLGLYYILPWLQWDGRQALLLDMPARKFYIFGLTLWPQDFILLAGLLIIAGLSLFFFTALAGRLWCGYACPQTVWTETFLWIEHWIEGDRLQQMKLDAGPMTARKFRIKFIKHLLWAAFALFTGFTFVAYFTPLKDLAHRLLTFDLGPWETFWLLFYSFATWGNAGFLREQVCKYMCPYARFQSAMFDDDTLVISYDEKRGEPRGSRKRGVDALRAGLGDCIDCTMCVQVCPTGIDIRKGLQYECIGCSSCIDVCNDVMDRMGYSHGLIRYTTQNALAGKPTRIIRPRIVIYAFVLLCIFGVLAYAAVTRVPLKIDVMRDRNQLYREMNDGMIENVYALNVINMDEHPHVYSLSVSGIDGLKVDMDSPTISVDASTVKKFVLRLRADPAALKARSSHVKFELRATDAPNLVDDEDARFLGPTPSR